MDKELEKYVGIVSFFRRIFTDTYEIFLFDTTVKNYPVVAHSSKTGENIRCTRQLLSKALKSNKAKEIGMMLNIPVQPELGSLLKSSVYLIKKDEQNIIGALCVNVQCNVYLKIQSLISGILDFNPDEINDDEDITDMPDIRNTEPTLDTITQLVNNLDIEPGRCSQGERIDIVCDLYNHGVFGIKGSVAKTAEALGISEQSVYRYLAQIKKARS